MDTKRVLGLGLASVALALVVWGLFFAKMSMVSIKIDLPPAHAPKSPPAPKPVDVFIDAKGEIRVNGRPSSLDALARDVAAVSTAADKREQRVMIRGADNIKYETFMAVLERLQAGGWYKVGLINEDIR
jgi:biopolymer transport protein ExbD